jgi:hypothetical protein
MQSVWLSEDYKNLQGGLNATDRDSKCLLPLYITGESFDRKSP